MHIHKHTEIVDCCIFNTQLLITWVSSKLAQCSNPSQASRAIPCARAGALIRDIWNVITIPPWEADEYLRWSCYAVRGSGWRDLQAVGSAPGSAEPVGWGQWGAKSGQAGKRPCWSDAIPFPSLPLFDVVQAFISRRRELSLITLDLFVRNEDQWQQINTNDFWLP